MRECQNSQIMRKLLVSTVESMETKKNNVFVHCQNFLPISCPSKQCLLRYFRHYGLFWTDLVVDPSTMVICPKCQNICTCPVCKKIRNEKGNQEHVTVPKPKQALLFSHQEPWWCWRRDDTYFQAQGSSLETKQTYTQKQPFNCLLAVGFVVSQDRGSFYTCSAISDTLPLIPSRQALLCIF